MWGVGTPNALKTTIITTIINGIVEKKKHIASAICFHLLIGGGEEI